jgi:NodT family efflux transporter outer membrane factor (OMF) lipoprotein
MATLRSPESGFSNPHPGSRWRWLGIAVLTLLLGACKMGPDYVRPENDAPAAFKEAENWKPAEPAAHLDRGAWWTLYHDPQLDALQAQLGSGNLNVRIAESQFRQAQAALAGSRAGLLPSLGASAGETRSQPADPLTGLNRTPIQLPEQRFGPFGALRIRPPAIPAPEIDFNPRTQYNLGLSSSWEIDLWGRVRRQVEANTADLAASAADLQSMRLSMQAQLAQFYFALRVNDTLQAKLRESVAAYEQSLRVAENRYKGGVTSRADVLQAKTQLRSTQAQATDLQVQRAQLEHAIAVLIGKPPAQFSLAPSPLVDPLIPVVPAGLPSALLERRPDIAAAERRMAAANAQIGVAKAAYFPSLTLSASGGYQGTSLGDLISLPNQFWSIGPRMALSLFDGGLRDSQVDQAEAILDATASSYRLVVLGGFQEVEDQLAALRILEEEARTQAEAEDLARQSLQLTTNQYKAGVVSYLNVVTAQTILLESERTRTALVGQQLGASIDLIRALGGTWSSGAEKAPARADVDSARKSP